MDDRQLAPGILQKVLEDRLLWLDPNDAEIKLSSDEKCAAYGSQALKQIFEDSSKSAPNAKQESAKQQREEQEEATQSKRRTATRRKVQAKGKGKVSSGKEKGKAKVAVVDEDSDVEMEDLESEASLSPPPPHQASAKRPRAVEEAEASTSNRAQDQEQPLFTDESDDSPADESGGRLSKRAKIDAGEKPWDPTDGGPYTLNPPAPRRNAGSHS